eukprot:3940267-Rhodomonas_salina.2
MKNPNGERNKGGARTRATLPKGLPWPTTLNFKNCLTQLRQLFNITCNNLLGSPHTTSFGSAQPAVHVCAQSLCANHSCWLSTENAQSCSALVLSALVYHPSHHEWWGGQKTIWVPIPSTPLQACHSSHIGPVSGRHWGKDPGLFPNAI